MKLTRVETAMVTLVPLQMLLARLVWQERHSGSIVGHSALDRVDGWPQRGTVAIFILGCCFYFTLAVTWMAAQTGTWLPVSGHGSSSGTDAATLCKRRCCIHACRVVGKLRGLAVAGGADGAFGPGFHHHRRADRACASECVYRPTHALDASKPPGVGPLEPDAGQTFPVDGFCRTICDHGGLVRSNSPFAEPRWPVCGRRWRCRKLSSMAHRSGSGGLALQQGASQS